MTGSQDPRRVGPAPLWRRRPPLSATACALAAFAAAAPAFAQEPAQPAPADAAPVAAPDAAPDDVETPDLPPGVSAANGEGLRLNFRDASIDTVLDELSRVAGFVVVKTAVPAGRITLVSRQPVDPAQAVVLLNTVLHESGFAAVQQGRILKILSAEQARHANIPVHSGSDPAAIEPTDQLITQVIPLRFTDATQLREDLQPLVNPDAGFTANASSNALVITDTAANIRRVVEIVQALDRSLAESVDVRVFTLTYASATEAASLVNSVFENAQPATGQSGEDDDDDRRRRRPPWMRGDNDNNNQRAGKVTAAADERTNTVVVTGPTDSLPIVERVLRELDSNPVAEVAVFVYPLRNAEAINAEIVLNGLFNGTGGAVGATGGAVNELLNFRQGTSTQRNTRGGGSRATGTSRGGGGGGTFGGAFQGGQNQGRGGRGQGGRNVPQNVANAAADLAGQVTIIADPDTNSLLVRTVPKNYDRVKQVIEELDRPLPQVLIKVLIAEVTHDSDLDLGFEFASLNLRANGLGSTVGTDFNVADQSDGLIVQVLESDFTATLRALEQNGKLEVLSRPYILASDNQLATITVGQEVPFITNTRVTDQGGIINTIEYSDIGILLDVIPHINPQGLVILDVAPEISTITGTTVPISETVSAPVFAKRSALSRVAVPTGRTVVIGGLMEDRKTESISKVPILGDIPLIGEAFKRRRITKAKTELLIFLTPHVAAEPEVLTQMGEDEVRGTHLVPEALDDGTFEEHREGLRRGHVPLSPNAPRMLPTIVAPLPEDEAEPNPGLRPLLPDPEPANDE